MPRARIQINGVTQTTATVTIGSTVILSNDDEGGELTYAWSFVDQPEGAIDTISNTAIENPTFTPLKEGSYQVRLVVNALLPSEAIQTAIVAVLDARTQERFPAVTETTEVSTTRGWAQAVNRILIRAMRDLASGGATVVAHTPGGIVTGRIVSFRGVATINSGSQAQDVVPSIALATATSAAAVAGRLGVMTGGVVPGQTSSGNLVIVQTFGILGNPPSAATGTPTTIGDPVYVSNTGTPSLTPGSNVRQIGRVVSLTDAIFGSGFYNWCIDDTASGGGGLADGDYGDIVVSGSGSALTVDANAITNAKLAQMSAFTIKGNATGSSAAPTDMTVGTLLGLLNLSGYDIGNQSDGSHTMDGTAVVPGYTLTNPGPTGVYTANRRANFTNLTVSLGILVDQRSHPGPFARGVMNNNGVISWAGTSATSTGGATNPPATGPLPIGSAGGNGGAVNTNGGPGQASLRCPRGFSTTAAGAGVAGGIGHGGGGGTGLATGGAAGNITLVATASGDINSLDSAYYARIDDPSIGTKYTAGTGGGGGAGGGGIGEGGGGGAAGCWGVFGAGSFTGSGVYDARGGDGLVGGDAISGSNQIGGSGGGGGGGGFIVCIAPSGSPPTVLIAGGVGAAGGTGTGIGGSGGTGGNGGAGLQLNWI